VDVAVVVAVAVEMVLVKDCNLKSESSSLKLDERKANTAIEWIGLKYPCKL
jgi:hypothetical protein